MTTITRRTGAARRAPTRRSIRLKGYDYTRAGAYFITICTFQREWMFGEVVNGEMYLNATGRMVEAEWANTQQLRINVELGPSVIMPNHFHGIILILDADDGDTDRGGTDRGGTDRWDMDRRDMTRMGTGCRGTARRAPTIKYEQFGKPVAGSIPTIVRAFKSAVTRQINLFRNTPGSPVWQRNYYEHVIRNEKSYYQIAEYIQNNPVQWELDTLYSGGTS